MSNAGPSIHPPKRRKIGRKPAPMVEGEDSSVDTLMYISHTDGTNVQKVLIPVQSEERPIRARQQVSDPVPSPPVPDHDQNWPADGEQAEPPNTQHRRDRWFYMNEFVARADGILQALQDKEALPDPSHCAECGNSAGRWRCNECIGCRPLCRRCMRHSHFAHPFHRIQYWTGSHFRPAALWEVGVYLMLTHRCAPSMCATLTWQKDVLERLQGTRDHDHVTLNATVVLATTVQSAEPEPHISQKALQDAAYTRLLDQLHERPDEHQELEEDYVGDLHDTTADIQDAEVGGQGFQEYMDGNVADPDQALFGSFPETPEAPSRDALSNQYIRVVHINGIHHISLVICACRSHDEVFNDLIYAGMVPTSFIKIRTIFTTAVLDRFRICNLEMKSSAYQFFQMLRRLTNPMNPYQVTNIYHELRRLSRLWRWVKKIRWAGYAQQAGQHSDAQPGGLGNFCPACPQIGVNVPDGWTDDPDQWVFRRVLTADGNFKADHVRQKAPADDIWLYDGLGMTMRRPEYSVFLESAQERKTVSSSCCL